MLRCLSLLLAGSFFLAHAGAMEEVMPMAGGTPGTPGVMRTQVTLRRPSFEAGRAGGVDAPSARRMETPAYLDIPGLIEPETLIADRSLADAGARPPAIGRSFPPAELYRLPEPGPAGPPMPSPLDLSANYGYSPLSVWSPILPADIDPPADAILDSPSLPLPSLPALDASAWLGERDRNAGVRRLGMK